MSAIFLDRITPSYTALLDRHGDLIAGFADMELYDLAFPKQLRRSLFREAVGAHDAILCDANVPQDGLERIAEMSRGKSIYAIAVSPAKAVRLRSVLSKLSCLFMNRCEACALAGETDFSKKVVETLRALGLGMGVITAGKDALILFNGDTALTLQPPAPAFVADVTGAGDALAGATIAAMFHGKAPPDALREGVAAALLAIECPNAVPSLEDGAFTAKLALVPYAQAMA
jgi:sugar/nucleoside kinase (ribokinase family)